MRTRHIILISMLLICCCFNLSWADTGSDKALSTAKAWLSLIDSGNYSGSWKDASTYFQATLSEQNWVSALRAVRKPLGELVGRSILTSQEFRSLPGVPDGKYIVMNFETAFEHKKSAVETLTFMLDKDGKWRAAGYFIK